MEDLEDDSYDLRKLIIQTRLDLEPEFQEGKKKKSVLWDRVIAKIKETKPDFDLTREQTSRKFLNLQTTYRRIQNRKNSTGRLATAWEFYDMFDEIYGAKHSINSPVKNLQSSLYPVEETLDEKRDFDVDDPICCSSDNSTDSPLYQKRKKPKIANENSMLEFLKEEAIRDERRHKEVMELERRKIKIEQERIKAMVDLKNILQKMLEK